MAFIEGQSHYKYKHVAFSGDHYGHVKKRLVNVKSV